MLCLQSPQEPWGDTSLLSKAEGHLAFRVGSGQSIIMRGEDNDIYQVLTACIAISAETEHLSDLPKFHR